MLLQLIDIKKSYGGTAVLCNVCTRLNKGDKVAIIGKNGAGKTTLLRILTGEVNSDCGDVQVAVGSRIGYLAQHNDFLPQSTVFEEMHSAFAFVKTALDNMRRIETELRTCLQKNYSKINRYMI